MTSAIPEYFNRALHMNIGLDQFFKSLKCVIIVSNPFEFNDFQHLKKVNTG